MEGDVSLAEVALTPRAMLTSLDAEARETMDTPTAQSRTRRVLTTAEVVSLAKRIEAGDRDAWQQLVCCNLRLVATHARKFVGHGVPFADLVQEGSLGLMHAVDKFDYRLGYSFSTYAHAWIRHYLQVALRRQGPVVRLPSSVADKVRALVRVKADLTQELGRSPNARELADAAAMSVADVQRLQALAQPAVSLEAMIPGLGEAGAVGFAADDHARLGEEVDRAILKEQAHRLLASLDDESRTIVTLRYGLEGASCMSYREIGRLVGISREWARKLEGRALECMRKRHGMLVGASVGALASQDELNNA